MSGKNIGIIIVVAIVFLAIGAGGVFLYQQSETNNLESELKALNDENDDLIKNLGENNEFIRYYARANSKIADALINDGLARAYEEEADYHYELGIYDWSENYYSFAIDYYGYARDGFGTSIILLNQADDYSTNIKTTDYIQKYIDLYEYSKDISSMEYSKCDKLRLASYYYNLSDWDAGDIELEKSNDYLDELNNYITEQNDIITEIEIFLENSWKEYI